MSANQLRHLAAPLWSRVAKATCAASPFDRRPLCLLLVPLTHTPTTRAPLSLLPPPTYLTTSLTPRHRSLHPRRPVAKTSFATIVLSHSSRTRISVCFRRRRLLPSLAQPTSSALIRLEHHHCTAPSAPHISTRARPHCLSCAGHCLVDLDCLCLVVLAFRSRTVRPQREELASSATPSSASSTNKKPSAIPPASTKSLSSIYPSGVFSDKATPPSRLPASTSFFKEQHFSNFNNLQPCVTCLL